MYFLVVLILDDPDDCPAVLNAWENAGASGVTILDSSGLGHLRQAGLRDDLPLMPSLHDLLGGNEVHHRTLFSVVEGQEAVDRLVATAQEQLGNLDEPHSGFMFVVPVAQAYGLGSRRAP